MKTRQQIIQLNTHRGQRATARARKTSHHERLIALALGWGACVALLFILAAVLVAR